MIKMACPCGAKFSINVESPPLGTHLGTANAIEGERAREWLALHNPDRCLKPPRERRRRTGVSPWAARWDDLLKQMGAGAPVPTASEEDGYDNLSPGQLSDIDA